MILDIHVLSSLFANLSILSLEEVKRSPLQQLLLDETNEHVVMFEEALYCSAPSLAAYADTSTLKMRLEPIIFQQTRQRSEALFLPISDFDTSTTTSIPENLISIANSQHGKGKSPKGDTN